jgi:hypothetical protein
LQCTHFVLQKGKNDLNKFSIRHQCPHNFEKKRGKDKLKIKKRGAGTGGHLLAKPSHGHWGWFFGYLGRTTPNMAKKKERKRGWLGHPWFNLHTHTHTHTHINSLVFKYLFFIKGIFIIWGYIANFW